MRYFLFLLLTAILVACTAEVSQETPSPVAIMIETLPPAGADTPTLPPTATATLPPTNSPTETATPLLTDSPTPAPFIEGSLLLFWDTETLLGHSEPGFAPEPGSEPKQDLYLAIPNLSSSHQWQTTSLIRNLLDWETHSPSWPTAVLSPNKTKIAFDVLVYNPDPNAVDSRSLYVYDLVKEQLIQLTQASSILGYNFSWLPDSQTLVYSWGSQIYTINLNDLAPNLLFNLPDGSFTTLKWSPIESILAFELNFLSPQLYNVFFLNTQTNSIIPLTNAVDMGFNTLIMEWASTGEWFAYNDTKTAKGLFVTNVHTLETLTIVPNDMFSSATWSPDGQKLVFTIFSSPIANEGQTFLWDSFTLQTTQLLDRPILPAWAPDSLRLAFGFREAEIGHILIFDLVNNQFMAPLELGKADWFYIWNWSPDSQWLLYFAAQEDQIGLHLVNYDTRETQFILNTEGTLDPNPIFWLP